MKKTAVLAAAVMLLTLFLNSGAVGLRPVALAAPGDVIPLNANFLAALVAAGVDADSSGTITEGEMAAPTLTSLSVSGVAITDITGIGYAVNLTSLSVTGTSITTLPDEISNLTKLTTLDLMMNDIATLPEGIGNLTNLTDLNLYMNGLTALPATIGNLNKLKSLVLHKNRLSSLPDSFFELVSLETITLWDNRLTALPAGVFNAMNALRSLDIAYNYLNLQAGNPDMTELNVARGKGATVVSSPQRDYAVSLDKNGGTGSNLPKARYYHGESVTLPAAAKSGFVFGGWDADGDGTVDAHAGDAVVIAPSPVTAPSVVFKAVYGYTVTFRTERFGTIDGGDEDIVAHVNAGEHIQSVPVAAPLADYEFLGWYDGAAKVTEAQILAMDITSNKSFTARYQAIGTIDFADPGFGPALIAAGADPNDDGFVTAVELAAVTSLNLSAGQFSNIAGIGGATALQTLTLGSHGIDTLPAELGTLINLQSLDVSGNPISALPDLSGLASLVSLDISDCAFADVPDGADLPSSLTSLSMADNGIGTLPAWLLADTVIEALDLSGNLFTTLPANCFAAMTALSALDLGGNYLNSGALPEGLPGFANTASQTTYAITLDFDGGTGAAPRPSGYYYGEEIPLPEAARAESIFLGWDLDGDQTADVIGAGATTLTPNPPDSITGKTYTAIYISQNARLSSVGLSAGAYIAPAFDPESAGCTVTLYDYVGSVTITPQKSSSKAALRIDGEVANNVVVTLASSSASRDVVVEVMAEDGTTTHTYTLHVVRAPVVSLSLTSIRLSPAVTMSPKFAMATTAYTALLPATVGSVTVSVAKNSAQTTARLDGVVASSRAYSVGLGLTKTVTIVVSSPLTTDKTKTYKVTLKRATTVSGFTAVPKVGTTPTLSPGGSNRMTFSYRMNGPGTAKIEIYKSGRWYPVLTRAETAGAKSWAWDGKVSGRYLAVGTYKARITPVANGMAATAYTLSVKIVKYPTVTWRSYARTFRAKGTVYSLCTFKVNYPTNATVQVINSRGKVAAAVKSFTNMPPSKYYSVAWNGKATAGNTAGLKTGALVPTGTYTLRITVGPRYYYKTIKITR